MPNNSDQYIQTMKDRIFSIIDPNNEYTFDDFNKEFMEPQKVDNYFFELKFENTSTNQNPEYATSGSSGFDLRANLPHGKVYIPSGGGVAVIPTGLFFEIPQNFELQIRSRSGLAAKNNVAVLNSPGTVDSDYRGEVKVILINHDKIKFFEVNHGDRIAQAVIASVVGQNVIKLSQVAKISTDTERSSNGFGSTGLQ